jgi:serine/threonine protein phosphatase 1
MGSSNGRQPLTENQQGTASGRRASEAVSVCLGGEDTCCAQGFVNPRATRWRATHWIATDDHCRENELAWSVLTSRARKAKPQVPAGHRVYAVGDVHGRADLLKPLLARVEADLAAQPVAQPIEVFLGDYIDRGPDSREVLDLLVARQRTRALRCLKGNHEALADQFLADPSLLSDWKRLGGLQTLVSYGVAPSLVEKPGGQGDAAAAFRVALPDSHRAFIRGLALSFTCGDFFFVHAGVRPGVSLAQQRPEDLLWIREEFLLHEEDFGKVVVHGHTPTIEPEVRANRINIDTGAYATGRLTCLVLEGDRVRFI